LWWWWWWWSLNNNNNGYNFFINDKMSKKNNNKFHIDKQGRYICKVDDDGLEQIKKVLKSQVLEPWISLIVLPRDIIDHISRFFISLNMDGICYHVKSGKNGIFSFGYAPNIQSLIDIMIQEYGVDKITVKHWAPLNNPLRCEIYYPYTKEPLLETTENRDKFFNLYLSYYNRSFPSKVDDTRIDYDLKMTYINIDPRDDEPDDLDYIPSPILKLIN
jgi:hypothetical protein